MEESEKRRNRKKPINESITYSVPFSLEEIKEDITIYTNKASKEEIINQAINLHIQGNIKKASKYYQYCIDQGFNDHRVFANFGSILIDFGKPEEAELSLREAIKLNPNFAQAHTNLGGILKNQGKSEDAEKSYRQAIQLNPDLSIANYNLGSLLIDLGKLEEAELYTRKAIKLNNKCADSHINLGNIMRILGKLESAETLYQKAIELNPDFSLAYYALSTLQYKSDQTKWQDKLFSESILMNKQKNELVDIYFARANILHKQKNFKDSSKNLKLANQLKLHLTPYKPDALIEKSQFLILESDRKKIDQTENDQSPKSIFIVGMPRSGSTLLESILSMNNNVIDLGEINILEESFLKYKKNTSGFTLAELYWETTNTHKNKFKITTNKWLYNYQYSGIIASEIPNAKIIHCVRNPLDNILSIYRTSFSRGNEYSSSLVDCTKVYLDQERIMTEYKNRFNSKIYDFNYDSLVTNPKNEIKSLISWLGWEWDDSYLTPHLNPRSVSTASSVQVRSPINSNSIGGWKNYTEMLKPAIEILTKTYKYKDIAS